MDITLFNSRKFQVWLVVTLVASLGFAWAIAEQIQHHKAGNAFITLRRLITTDSRFARVQIHNSTNARIWLDGEVASANDLAALQTLVKQTNVPPAIGVFVSVRLPALRPRT